MAPQNASGRPITARVETPIARPGVIQPTMKSSQQADPARQAISIQRGPRTRAWVTQTSAIGTVISTAVASAAAQPNQRARG